MTDDALAQLSNLSSIQELELNGNPITNRGLRFLQQMKSLRKLQLRDTKIDLEGLSLLNEFRQLSIVSLSGNLATGKWNDLPANMVTRQAIVSKLGSYYTIWFRSFGPGRQFRETTVTNDTADPERRLHISLFFYPEERE